MRRLQVEQNQGWRGYADNSDEDGSLSLGVISVRIDRARKAMTLCAVVSVRALSTQHSTVARVAARIGKRKVATGACASACAQVSARIVRRRQIIPALHTQHIPSEALHARGWTWATACGVARARLVEPCIEGAKHLNATDAIVANAAIILAPRTNLTGGAGGLSSGCKSRLRWWWWPCG